jgi:hypothetical protein
MPSTPTVEVTMSVDQPIRTDPSTPVTEAVCALAVDAFRVLTRAADVEPDRYNAALAELQRRAVDLLDWVGEGRIDDGRPYAAQRWLEALQRRIFTRQWLGDSLEDRLGIGRPGRDRLSASPPEVRGPC